MQKTVVDVHIGVEIGSAKNLTERLRKKEGESKIQ